MNTFTKKLLFLTAFCVPFLSIQAQNGSTIDDNIYSNLPFDMPKVQQPVFPDYEVSIVKFGAKGDGVTLNTKAINDAIKDVNQRGGGKVIIPEGLWLTGPIVLLSNVNLFTEHNALVYFTSDFEAYPIIETSLKDWRLVVVNLPFPHAERRISQLPVTAHLTVTVIAGVRSKKKNLRQLNGAN